MTAPGLGSLPFVEAADLWLESRKPFIGKNTFRDYTIYIRTVATYFAEKTLKDVSSDDIRAYQLARKSGATWSTINKETSVLQQMLKRIGRCITDEEESRFFTRRAWSIAAWASLLSVNTTMCPGEILHLRLRDLDLSDKNTVRVSPEGATDRTVRVGTIPLKSALWASRMFLARARHECHCAAPEHYLIPFNEAPNPYNPYKPQGRYYKAFNAILERAQLDFRLRFPAHSNHAAARRSQCSARSWPLHCRSHRRPDDSQILPWKAFSPAFCGSRRTCPEASPGRS